MVYMFLAPGFEEAEAIVPLDLLRRAGIEILTAGVGGRNIKGSHGITISCDLMAEELIWDKPDMIILPGGMPGTKNLAKSPKVIEYIRLCAEEDRYIAAICAAPSIIGKMGLLSGKRATCFPGYEDALAGASISKSSVCTDGKIITARAAGAAFEFAESIIFALKGETASKSVLDSVYYEKKIQTK